MAKIVTDNVAKETYLHTDESRLYGDADLLFAEHATVKHSAGEYVRYEADRAVHTNTIEGVSRISSAACVASTSTVTKSTFTGTSPNLISLQLPDGARL